MVSCGISTSFPVLFPTERKVAHALLTRPPLEDHPKAISPLDLHVLSTPPAFVLSQDQTLAFNPVYFLPVSRPRIKLIRNYCHNFAFHSLYRFQGSAPIRRCPARVSLHILSSSQRKVNTLFEVFCAFFIVFENDERCSQNSDIIFRPYFRPLGRTYSKNVRLFQTHVRQLFKIKD